MKKRTFQLSARHDVLLCDLARKLDVTMTEVVQRALEALQEKEAKREKDLKP